MVHLFHQQEGAKGYIQELASPGGIALSMDGKAVAVADTGNNRLVKRCNKSLALSHVL